MKTKDIENTRPSVERGNIYNDTLLPTLTSLLTETLAKSNTAAENLHEENFLEKLQVYSTGTCHLQNLQKVGYGHFLMFIAEIWRQK